MIAQAVRELPDVEPCHYCGVPADSVDHFVPQTVAKRMLVVKQRLIPACRECNSALGARFYPTLRARTAAVKESLRRRYRKVLATPDWKDQECDVLGVTLKSSIRNRGQLRELVKARLSWRRAEYGQDAPAYIATVTVAPIKPVPRILRLPRINASRHASIVFETVKLSTDRAALIRRLTPVGVVIVGEWSTGFILTFRAVDTGRRYLWEILEVRQGMENASRFSLLSRRSK